MFACSTKLNRRRGRLRPRDIVGIEAVRALVVAAQYGQVLCFFLAPANCSAGEKIGERSYCIYSVFFYLCNAVKKRLSTILIDDRKKTVLHRLLTGI